MTDDLTCRLDDKRDDLVELTRALVAIPTVNPPGYDYRACAELIGERLQQRGFTVRYVRADGSPGDSARYPRWNVIARFEGRGPGSCVHLNGHLDVVPAGRGWSQPAFTPWIADGRVYGRGTCDMKGGLAAAIIALETLLEHAPDLPGTVELSATADEETGGHGGVAYLAERGWFAPTRVDHVIIPEPLNVDRVCLGHRGVWWGEIETFGRIAHGSMPFLGHCAVRDMGAVLHALESEYLPALNARATTMPVVPPAARHATFNINSLHGGMAEADEDFTGLPAPCVPDSCRLVFDRRFLPEEDLPAVKAEMRALLARVQAQRPGFDYTLRDMLEVLPSLTAEDAPVVQAVCAAIRDVLHKDAELVASPGTYDQKHLQRIAQLQGCVAYGPGILDLAHRPDEFVIIDDLVASAKVLAHATRALLIGGAC